MGATHQESQTGETHVAEVANQRLLERYKDLLANRTHDVIVRDVAIEMLEAEVARLTEENKNLDERIESLKTDLNRANDVIQRISEKPDPPVVEPTTLRDSRGQVFVPGPYEDTDDDDDPPYGY